MRRRDFVTLISGAAAAWPLAARAQQPVIGMLATASAEANAARLRAFYQGLHVEGYVEGDNVKLEYRWAEADSGRLPELASELVQQKVTVLVAAGGTASALAAKTATAKIPIVFAIAGDPVALGLVASLSRPRGNVTGVTSLNLEVVPKRLQLMAELLPSATNMALLIDPAVPDLAEPATRLSQEFARGAGLQLHVLHANSERDFDLVFETLTSLHVNALVIAPDNLFTARSERLAELTVRHALPSVYQFRRFVVAGGLMSYGSSETEYYRLIGTYAGKILKGDKPTDLPVQQPTKLELMINLKTAKALGLSIPLPLVGRADEIIE
ncbi:ABC transporter substrate-binding protein [Bradyrhizobium sp. Tv2a-2]|uniref:ABC transporter substrate-binding protein n=1 Tax=Bradyrhizobium sp. Tv2a-2 TaxID=113395 RepID=UPI0003FCD8CB|nr:ABC transporter substrate-binding protein [Bradyrhizobium sp. Tv2a-2]